MKKSEYKPVYAQQKYTLISVRCCFCL